MQKEGFVVEVMNLGKSKVWAVFYGSGMISERLPCGRMCGIS